MQTQEGLNKCDYCDGMEGYFEDASGNHVSCIEKEKAYVKIAELRQALTEANKRIDYANAGDLVTIPRDLVLAMEAKMKLYENTLKFISEQTLCTNDKRECVRAANEALEATK